MLHSETTATIIGSMKSTSVSVIPDMFSWGLKLLATGRQFRRYRLPCWAIGGVNRTVELAPSTDLGQRRNPTIPQISQSVCPAFAGGSLLCSPDPLPDNLRVLGGVFPFERSDVRDRWP